jgi:hypothetical protein
MGKLLLLQLQAGLMQAQKSVSYTQESKVMNKVTVTETNSGLGEV